MDIFIFHYFISSEKMGKLLFFLNIFIDFEYPIFNIFFTFATFHNKKIIHFILFQDTRKQF